MSKNKKLYGVKPFKDREVVYYVIAQSYGEASSRYMIHADDGTTEGGREPAKIWVVAEHDLLLE
jgi:hypothetical protein